MLKYEKIDGIDAPSIRSFSPRLALWLWLQEPKITPQSGVTLEAAEDNSQAKEKNHYRLIDRDGIQVYFESILNPCGLDGLVSFHITTGPIWLSKDDQIS